MINVDVNIINGTYWHLFFHGCEDVYARGLTIRGDRPRWTNDGISGFVLISNPTQDNIPVDFCLNGNVTECKIINEKYIMEKCSLPSQIEKESVLCVWVNPEEARK